MTRWVWYGIVFEDVIHVVHRWPHVSDDIKTLCGQRITVTGNTRRLIDDKGVDCMTCLVRRSQREA